MNLKVISCLSLVICALIASCASAPDTVQSPRATIDAMAGVQPAGIPDHFLPDEPAAIPRAPGDWDVNAYFGVLSLLSVEPGYAIDYMYIYDGLGGYPFVYARASEKRPYASYEEYLANVPGGGQDSGTSANYSREYLDHIEIEDTPDGYFQFVLLRIMGSQFYQFWHAEYGDTTIVCDSNDLEKALAAAAALAGSRGLDEVRKEAKKVDLRPTAELLDDSSAVVRLVTFSKWGGLVELRYTISRQFPHTLISTEAETLVEYDSGVAF